MSGTKSPSRKAPATDVLIVAHGLPSDTGAGETAIARVAAHVQTLLPGRKVSAVTMAAEGALERAVGGLNDEALVFPMFMSDGWFVRTELPRRLGRSAVRVLPPFGQHPQLPMLAAQTVRSRMSARGWKANRTHVVIAAHGSGRSPKPAEATKAFASAMSRRLRGVKVNIGYIDEPPSIADAAQGLPESSICLPFFAADGGHVADDVPDALTSAGFRGELLQPIGLHREIPSLIAGTLTQYTQTGTAA